MVKNLNSPTPLIQPIAENGDKNIIPATNNPDTGLMSQSLGFPPITSVRLAEGGKAPKRADMNGALNMISSHTYFTQMGGKYTFNQAISDAIGGYPKDTSLWYVTANNEILLVTSLIENNTYNFVTNPNYIDDGIHWRSDLPTKAYMNTNYVTVNTKQVVNGEKTFTGILKVVESTQPRIILSPVVSDSASDCWGRIKADSDGVLLQNDRNNIGLRLNNSPTTITQANTTIPSASNDTTLPTTAWVNSRITAIMNNTVKVGSYVPNYASQTTVTSGFKTSNFGWLRITYSEHLTIEVKVDNNQAFIHSWGGGDYGNQYQCSFIPLAKGQTVTFSNTQTAVFLPIA